MASKALRKIDFLSACGPRSFSESFMGSVDSKLIHPYLEQLPLLSPREMLSRIRCGDYQRSRLVLRKSALMGRFS